MATNTVPSTAAWSPTEPRSGSTNCGRNARKKSAVFGLRTFTSTPCPNTLRRLVSTGSAASSPSRPSIRRTPITIRYAAPASLTTVNASADDASSAESPIAAAVTWTSPPHATPSAERRPARRPLSTLCVTMYVTAGPGTTISASAATQKTASVEAVGTSANRTAGCRPSPAAVGSAADRPIPAPGGG